MARPAKNPEQGPRAPLTISVTDHVRDALTKMADSSGMSRSDVVTALITGSKWYRNNITPPR